MLDDATVYDEWAPTYHKLWPLDPTPANPVSQSTRKYANILLGEDWIASKRGGRALDMACNIGIFTLSLGHLGFVAEGIDMTPGMIAECERLWPDQGLSFFIGDCLTHDCGKTYDVIYQSASLLYGFPTVEEKQALFQKCHALLNPGGKLFFRLSNVDELIETGFQAPWLHFNRNFNGEPLLDVYDWFQAPDGQFGVNFANVTGWREVQCYTVVQYPCLVSAVSPMMNNAGFTDIRMKEMREIYNTRRQWWVGTKA